MKKRILSALLALTLAGSVCACAAKDEPTQPATEAATAPTVAAAPAAEAKDKPQSDVDVPEFVKLMQEGAYTAPREKEPAPRAVAEDVQPPKKEGKKRDDPFDDILRMFRDKNN